jgi:hypothetical protein
MKTPMLYRVQDYRVRLPSDLYPYKGKQVIQVKHVSDLDVNSSEWLRIEKAATDRASVGISSIFQSAFDKRHPFNLPGPFYGAETDTCETGPAEAPTNVLMDRKGQEFVCKQPNNEEELRDIISAALCECFSGYGADGDFHWNLRLIRQWWRSRTDLLAQVSYLSGDPGSITNWRRLLSGEGEQYLRVHTFLVEERRLPAEADPLPSVS